MSIAYDRSALRRIRQTKRITLQELADRAGVTRQAIHFIERRVVEPKAKTLAKLATALGVGVEEFFSAG